LQLFRHQQLNILLWQAAAVVVAGRGAAAALVDLELHQGLQSLPAQPLQ
jgi:hypothetical protein